MVKTSNMPAGLKRYWNARNARREPAKSGGGGHKKPIRRTSKKYPTVPVASFVQGAIILEAATGMRADDIINPVIDVCTGAMTTDAFKDSVGAYIRSILTYWIENPTNVLINTAVAAFWTSLIRKVLRKAGCPRRILVAQMFYLEVC